MHHAIGTALERHSDAPAQTMHFGRSQGTVSWLDARMNTMRRLIDWRTRTTASTPSLRKGLCAAPAGQHVCEAAPEDLARLSEALDRARLFLQRRSRQRRTAGSRPAAHKRSSPWPFRARRVGARY